MKNLTTNTYRSVREIPDLFNELFAQSSKQNVFSLKEWFLLLEDFVYTDSVVIFTVVANVNEPLMVLPCYESKTEHGKQLHVLENYYTGLYKPITNPGIPELDLVYQALLNIINTYHYQSICFQPLDHKSNEFSLLNQCLKENGYYVEKFFYFGNWYEKINTENYLDYFHQRPSKLKNTLIRKKKKLSNHEIVIAKEPDIVSQLLPDYLSIYSSSWKVEEEFPKFIESMVRIFSQLGILRLGVAYIDEKPAAAQIWFVHEGGRGNTASIFKLAYAPKFKASSIGTILTSAMMEYVIEKDNVTEVDFLSGDDAYKKDWMSSRRERWGIVAYNKRTIYGILRMIKVVMKKLIKNLLNKFNKLK